MADAQRHSPNGQKWPKWAFSWTVVRYCEIYSVRMVPYKNIYVRQKALYYFLSDNFCPSLFVSFTARDGCRMSFLHHPKRWCPPCLHWNVSTPLLYPSTTFLPSSLFHLPSIFHPLLPCSSLYPSTPLTLYHFTPLPRYHATTLPRYHATTLPLYHATTLPRYHSTTLLLYHSTTLLLYSGPNTESIQKHAPLTSAYCSAQGVTISSTLPLSSSTRASR